MRTIFNALVLVALTGFWSTLALPAAFIAPRRVPWIAHQWAKMVLAMVGVEAVLDGVEHIDKDTSFVIMPNHSSHFDVICLYATLPIPVRMVAKRELAYIPLFGWALAAGGAIMIDRGDRQKAIRSIERASRAVRSGASVLLFPEGTRTPQTSVQAMKKGPFHLARGTKQPILPIGIFGTEDVLRRGDWRIHRGRVVLTVGPPIPSDAEGPDDAVRTQLMAEVHETLERLRATSEGKSAGPHLLDTTTRSP